LTVNVSGPGHADYGMNGRSFVTYTQPVPLPRNSYVNLVAYADEGYHFKAWRVGSQEYTDPSVFFDDVSSSMVVELVFEKDGSGGGGGGIFGGGDGLSGAALWAVAALALLLAAGLLIWFLFFWRRSYEVVKVQSSANIIGKDRARRRSRYEFEVEGPGSVSYRVGEDGPWKPLSPGPDGGYAIPREDVIDKLTIEAR
ncbi:MAG: hypothetical protein FWH47_08250, partial [Methanomassiliicoccaceae archaeon]|nr:hypothetical protein [Methanomassiliicoccaceae archaeon]